MSTTIFDVAGVLNLIFRKNRDGQKVFVFKYLNGDDYDISGIEFQLFIKKKSTSTSNLLLFESGSGLSISGNELTFLINENQSNLAGDFYYWELYNVTTDETWINGNAYFITQSDSTDNTIDVTINLAVEEVAVTVSGSSSTRVSQYRGDFDPTGGVLPSSDGSGSGGTIVSGDEWTLTSELTISGKSYSSGSLIKAKINSPGQTITNWLVLSVQL